MNYSKHKKKLFRVTTVPVALYKLLKGQLRFLNQYYDVTGICSDTTYIDDLRKEEGITVHPIEIKREISLSSDIKALFKLWKLFRKQKPDIVHSHTPKAGLLSMVAARFAGVPVRIHTFTGIRFETTTGLLRWVLVTMDRITCSCATEIIPEGDGVRNTLLKNKITSKKLRKIRNGNINGIDLDHFNINVIDEAYTNKLKKDLEISENDFVMSFVGRIVGDKGINELARVFNSLSKNHPNIKLILVGPYEESLDPVTSETQTILNTNEQIKMVGLQQDIRPYLAVSDLFVFPSYREGFPNVVLQAGAMGLPCIVTDINGCNEIIKDNINGIIVKPQDEDSLKSAILQIIDNPANLSKLAEHARPMIASRFAQQEVWNGILERYKELTNENN